MAAISQTTHWSVFFLNENMIISLKISLKFVSTGPINNIPVLVQIMAWRRPGDKPLSEPMIIILLTHVCVTRPQLKEIHGDIFTKLLWLCSEACHPKSPHFATMIFPMKVARDLSKFHGKKSSIHSYLLDNIRKIGNIIQVKLMRKSEGSFSIHISINRTLKND